MPATGELIRSINYVDDIAVTLRRICLYIPAMDADERKRLSDALRVVRTAIDTALTDLDKAAR
jgi:hypothetical protein